MIKSVLFFWVATLAVPFCWGGDVPTFAERDHRYHLQAGDTIDLSYEYTPEYNQEILVGPDGYANLRLLGTIKLAKLTLDEATEQIRTLSATRLNKPEIRLVLKDYVKPHVVISGEVNKPGTYDVHGEKSAVQAISDAGGFKDTSNRKQVLWVRKLDSGVAQVHVIDFRRLDNAKGVQEDFDLQDGDILIVPRTRLAAIEPYVRVAAAGLTSLYAISIVK